MFASLLLRPLARAIVACSTLQNTCVDCGRVTPDDDERALHVEMGLNCTQVVSIRLGIFDAGWLADSFSNIVDDADEAEARMIANELAGRLADTVPNLPLSLGEALWLRDSLSDWWFEADEHAEHAAAVRIVASLKGAVDTCLALS